MRKFTDIIFNQVGTPVAGATVTVRVANASPGTGALATIYSDDGLNVIAGSAVTTDLLGRFYFYAADGRYDYTITGTNITSETISDLGEGGINLAAQNLNAIRFADKFAVGGSVGAQIDAACTDLAGAQGLVVIPSSMGTGWSLAGVPSNVTILDLRGNGGSTQTAYVRGVDFYNRITSVNPVGLQLPSNVLLELDAYGGGINQLGNTKTQWQNLRTLLHGRTIGERKAIEAEVRSYGKGDSIGIMATSYDWGGFSTGGDEGSEGGRFTTSHGFGDGVVPVGTVSAVNGNTITGSWTAGTNAYLGEQRPLINTSRGVYTTGTLASGSGAAPFTIVGSGTSWLSLGSGAVSDLFLEYTAFNGSARFVIPVLTIVDNTHLTAEFNLVQLGAANFNPSGAYKIYRGGKVSSLVAPLSGNSNATGVVLDAGGSDFQVGDSIEQPLGYNYHGTGVQVVLKAVLALGGGGDGIYVSNIGSYEYAAGFRASGPFTDGITFDGALSRSGIHFDGQVGSLIQSFDQSAASQVVLSFLSTLGASRTLQYDRPNDFWLFGGLRAAGDGLSYGFGTIPVPGTYEYHYYNDATKDGLIVAPVTVGANKAIFDTQVSGVPRFRVENTKVKFNNGVDVLGYSDNATTQKWGVTGSTGAGRFDGGITLGGGTLVTKTVVYTPSLTPASCAANTSAEQTFTVSGLTTADKVIVNGPAPTAGTGIVNVRVSAADTLAITFANFTAGALTPTSGTYNIVAVRS